MLARVLHVGMAVTGNVAASKMELSAYFTCVHIPSFGRDVTGNAAASKMEVSAYFTSFHIQSIGVWNAIPAFYELFIFA